MSIGIELLKNTLETAMKTENSVLQVMSENGRVLIQEKYSIESVGKQMKAMYQELC